MTSFSQQLDQRVVFQAMTPGKDSSGGNTKAWVTVMERWAGLRHLSGSEVRTPHGGVIAEARTEITVWFDPAITAALRIVHKGRYYNIRHVNNFNEQNQKLILTCDTGHPVEV